MVGTPNLTEETILRTGHRPPSESWGMGTSWINRRKPSHTNIEAFDPLTLPLGFSLPPPLYGSLNFPFFTLLHFLRTQQSFMSSFWSIFSFCFCTLFFLFHPPPPTSTPTVRNSIDKPRTGNKRRQVIYFDLKQKDTVTRSETRPFWKGTIHNLLNPVRGTVSITHNRSRNIPSNSYPPTLKFY